MECKKWSAKGKCRKASADRQQRQVQKGKCRQGTHNVTQTRSVASDHVRIAHAHSAWPGFRAASFANFYQNRTKTGPKSTTNGANLAQWGGKGQPEINKQNKSGVFFGRPGGMRGASGEVRRG